TKVLPAGFYDYKYLVTFEDGSQRMVSDPCSRYGGKDVENQNSGFVIGPSPFPDVTPLAARRPLRDLVIYELNIDDFTDELRYSSEADGGRAALDAVRGKLDYLQKLGMNAILFLPWTAWADDFFSWGYTPYQYFSVEHRYTNDVTDPSPNKETNQLSRMRRLISECHERGIHVIMDGVFNHVGADTSPEGSGFAYRWLYQNPDASPYVGQFGGVFGNLKDLDYHNGCTQEFIRDVCFYWMDEFGIDGIRLDNTVNFYIAGDDRGLPRLLRDVADHADDENFSLTLEHIDITAAQVTNATRASSYWNNGQYETAFQSLWDYQITPKLLRVLDSHLGLNDGKMATTYLTNHDHAHVAWQAGARNDDGSMEWYRTQPGAIALFTSPGVPMISNGQEFGEDHWIPENDNGSNRRVKPRPLRWEFLNDKIGSSLHELYRRLIDIRKTNPALRTDNFYPSAWDENDRQFNSQGYGLDAQKQVVIYHRWGTDDHGSLQRLIVVLNFSQTDQFVDVPFSSGGLWTDLLNPGISFNLSDPWQRNWKVSSNWGNIFLHQG
ncbi:MAG TPA: alpha-amylase family glycosyl hydrolase, partial [Candidatus Limnocylindrales bacterium]|nr:alpha-amylase family glycosyl hydrolase [Candidatus Limnocylindrales bacterium]